MYGMELSPLFYAAASCEQRSVSSGTTCPKSNHKARHYSRAGIALLEQHQRLKSEERQRTEWLQQVCAKDESRLGLRSVVALPLDLCIGTQARQGVLRGRLGTDVHAISRMLQWSSIHIQT